MIKPNKHGVYNEGLEEIQYLGKKANLIILLAECDDLLWRYGLQCELHNTVRIGTASIGAWSGFGFHPNLNDRGHLTRKGALVAACEELTERVQKNRENPRSAAEVMLWIETLNPPRQQLTLLDAMMASI